jgi:hypothetical protein
MVFIRILDNGQGPKPRNPKCYTPLSEPGRIYLYMGIYYFPQQKIRVFELHDGMDYELWYGIAKNIVETLRHGWKETVAISLTNLTV